MKPYFTLLSLCAGLLLSQNTQAAVLLWNQPDVNISLDGADPNNYLVNGTPATAITAADALEIAGFKVKMHLDSQVQIKALTFTGSPTGATNATFDFGTQGSLRINQTASASGNGVFNFTSGWANHADSKLTFTADIAANNTSNGTIANRWFMQGWNYSFWNLVDNVIGLDAPNQSKIQGVFEGYNYKGFITYSDFTTNKQNTMLDGEVYLVMGQNNNTVSAYWKGAALPIPEPTSASLAAMAFLALFRRRRQA